MNTQERVIRKMARKDMKGAMGAALGASIKAEEKAITDRFERAEAIFSKTPAEQQEPVYPEPATKVTRDSFTMPETDYDLIASTRSRCLQAGMSVTKSEVLRAGLHALQEMSEAELKALFSKLEKVKTGRPNHTVQTV
jgi:hypothetical protein